MTEERQYTLTVNEAQARVLSEALSLYARVGIAQFEELLSVYDSRRADNEQLSPEVATQKYHKAREHLEQAKLELTGYSPNASHGIHSENVRDKYRVSYDMHRLIRHRMAFDRSPGGGHGVDFHEVSCTSTEQPLARFEEKR